MREHRRLFAEVFARTEETDTGTVRTPISTLQLHLGMHILEDIVRFGQALQSSTQRFEEVSRLNLAPATPY